MTEKIIISKDLNEWLEGHQTININDKIYSERFGRTIFNELICTVYDNLKNIENYDDILTAFGSSHGNSKVAHLWLLLNRDKWEVEKEELFYICIPEPDNVNAYLFKGGGLDFFYKSPDDYDRYKWTQEEIDKHEVAKHLQHFKKKVEK